MLYSLQQIFDDGGPLAGVESARFQGDPRFITAIALRFESLTAVFRAVPDDDTLAVTVGPLVPDADEVVADESHSAPWSSCLGREVVWAWRLTNHQGYDDGARIEFSDPAGTGPAVEMIVAASMIGLFVPVRVGGE